MLILLCAAFARMTPAQQPPSWTAAADQTGRRLKRENVITGRVIGPEGQPMADASVFAYRIGERLGRGHSATVDDDGYFKLLGLSPTAYVLFARAPGYVFAGIPIEDSVHRIGDHVTIRMVKGGVITGKVTDETGEPLVGVTVRPHRLRDPEGKPAISSVESLDLGVGITDDRGIYRVFGLRPGVYILSIGGHAYDAQVRNDAPTYYPSATRDAATEINLRAGEEVSGIDIRHRADRGRIVSGVVTGEVESSPHNSVGIMLKEVEGGTFEAATATDNTRGFVFYGAPDGEYELIASRENDAAETTSSARRPISVRGADVSGIELKLAPTASIAGRVAIESPEAPKKCSIKGEQAETSGQVQEQTGRRAVIEEILLEAVHDDPNPRPRISGFFRFDMYGRPPNEKGEFAMKGLEAGRYRITANLPDEGWRVRAITQSVAGVGKQSSVAAKKNADISRSGVAIKPGENLSGVEVIVAEDAATLDGRVVPGKDGMKLPSSLRAHLIPAEATSADDVIRYAETDVRGDGSFEFKHVAPGKYLLHARQVGEKEASDDQARPAAWDAAERLKLRREAMAAKNEIELQPCWRVKDYVLRFGR
ncbi:MAG TPA: carboxypeptidase-like regulatory domain-containing protein [Blastocatellia bacterium]|nr:carboxypeptidase-like regulatory domain-containing protein [Blastocatellia bacterium]